MKRVLITGGNKGIGLETTRLFHGAGYHVIVVARDFSGGLLPEGERIETIPFDLSETEKVPELAAKAGPVDVLVNNAGVMYALPFDAYPEEKAERMLALNLKTPVALIRELGKEMARNGVTGQQCFYAHCC